MRTSSHRVRRGLVTAAATAGLVGLGAQAALASVEGVDVARYQHPNGRSIDWSAVKASGQRFAVVKATEGRTYTNPYFAADFADMREAGLVRGAYHFASPDTSAGDAANEARHFVNVAGTMSGPNTLPLVLDLEINGGLGPARLVSWTKTWLSTVESLTGRRPIIYTGPSFWDSSMGGSRDFGRYPLWIAHYTSASSPRIPSGWNDYTIWQYTSVGRVPGITGDVDRNRFRGSETDLARLSNGVQTTVGLDVSSSGPTTLSGALRTGAGTGLVGAPLQVFTRAVGAGTWTQTASLTTAAGGSYSLRVDPATETEYHVRYVGDSLRLPSVSRALTVRPAPTTAPTTLGIRAEATQITDGEQTSVLGRLTKADGSGVPGRQVSVFRRPVGTTPWTLVDTVPTGSDGAYALSVLPRRNTEFTARFAGDAGHEPSSAGKATVSVAPAVAVQVSDTTPAAGSLPTLSGQVSPAHAGQTVHRQLLVDGQWRTWASTKLSSTGTYRFTLKPRRVDTFRHRVVKPADGDHVTAVSRTVTVTTH